MLRPRYLLATALLGAVAIVPAIPVSATTMMTSGTIKAFVNPANGPGLGTIYITGVIGDYGTTQNVTVTGTPNGNGNYARINLTKGGFWVNLTQLNKVGNNPHYQPTVYSTTCEALFTESAPAQVFKGNGAYAGITGTLNIVGNFIIVMPRLASGACNMAQSATPTHEYNSVIATGHVSY